MVKEKLKKLRNGFKTGGFEYLLCSFTSRFPDWMLTYFHSVCIKGEEVKLITRQYKDYEIRFANSDDINRMEKIDPDINKFLHRLNRGDTCAVVIKDGEIVSLSWASTGRLYNKYAGSIVNTGDDGFFLYGVYSVPTERLKGFFASCFKLQFAHYNDQNKIKKYGVIETSNVNSIKTHLRLGFSIVGETYFFTFLGISVCYYKFWPHKTKKFHIFLKRPPENLEWV